MRQSNGFCPAIVIDNVDPLNGGRVKVLLPRVSASSKKGLETWARIATLMAGNNRGTWFIPDVNDEVLVAFEGGTAGQCYVIGGLWSGTSSPPETMDANNDKKLLRSRNGVKITLDDQSGQESFIVEITDSNGNSVKLDTEGIIVNASTKVAINASEVRISSGMVSVDAGVSKFSGVVQCDTLISNSVVSASYTPGAGNIV